MNHAVVFSSIDMPKPIKMTMKAELAQIVKSLKIGKNISGCISNIQKLVNKHRKLQQSPQFSIVINALVHKFSTIESFATQKMLLQTILDILPFPKYRSMIFKPKLIKKMVKMLQLKTEDCQNPAQDAVALFVKENNSVETLYKLQVPKVLLERLSHSSNINNNIAIMDILSQLCKTSKHWNILKELRAFEVVVGRLRCDLNDENHVIRICQMIRQFHRKQVDFYWQILNSTTGFQTFKTILHRENSPDFVRVTIEDLMMDLLRVITFEMRKSKVALKQFGRTFEASDMTFYLLQSLVNPKNTFERKEKILSFLSWMLSEEWHHKLSSCRESPIVAQFEKISLESYLALYHTMKVNSFQRAACLTLIGLLHVRNLDDVTDLTLFNNFLFDLTKVFDGCSIIISQATWMEVGNCNHFIKEDEYKRYLRKGSKDDSKMAFDCARSTIDIIFVIISKAFSSIKCKERISDLFIPRILDHLETSPWIARSAKLLLLYLPSYVDLPDSAFNCNLIGRLLKKCDEKVHGCSHCLETFITKSRFFSRMKQNKWHHQEGTLKHVSEILSKPTRNRTRQNALIALPHLLSCTNCCIYFCRKYDVVSGLANLVYTCHGHRKEKYAYSLETLKLVLRELKMPCKLDQLVFGDFMNEGRQSMKRTSCLWLKNTDLKVLVNGKTFDVHRSVFSSSSPVFGAMLNGPFSEGSSCTIHLNDISAKNFQYLIHAIYGCFCGIMKCRDLSDLIHLLIVCDMYDLQVPLDRIVYRLGLLLQLPHGESTNIWMRLKQLPFLKNIHIAYLFHQVLRSCSSSKISKHNLDLLTSFMSVFEGVPQYFRHFEACSYVCDTFHQTEIPDF